eukprot:RCo000744
MEGFSVSAVSLGEPAKDYRLVELLQKELVLKRQRLQEGPPWPVGTADEASLREELGHKLERFLVQTNALGLHYFSLIPTAAAPPTPLAPDAFPALPEELRCSLKFLSAAESVARDESEF